MDIFKRPNGNLSGTPLARSQVVFDELGRVFHERQLLSDGHWSRKETGYDGAGNVAAVSETEDDALQTLHTTTYGSYDPFGRVGLITPPEGSTHKVQVFYAGVRSLTRRMQVKTSTAGEETVQHVEITDHHGRLWKVREPSGAGGDTIGTIYDYDVGNRLPRATTTDDADHVAQVRTFGYDGRGFLLAESHPEKVGGITYLNYDAHGHAHTRTDGGVTPSPSATTRPSG